MTVQVTVRLPDELVAFVDELVSNGSVRSRADAVARALRRDQRRRAALDDVEILRRVGDHDSELDAFVAFSSTHPPQLDE